jgi:uncharacterized integral membrane protein
MRAVGLIVLLVILLAAVFFSMANREVTELGLWPLDVRIGVPLFAPILGGVVLGFLIGWAGCWLKDRHVRRQLRGSLRECMSQSAEIDRLKAELKTAQSDQATGRDIAA